jgi:excisionase family DNA binding protein
MDARCRDWLSVHEVAVLLQRPAIEVRNMVRRGELADVRPGRLRGISPQQVLKLVVEHPLAFAVLEAIMAGRLHVGRLELHARPPSLMESWDAIR